MERYCSTGQSPQRAVAPTEEEERGGEEFEEKGEVYCLQHKNAQHISLQWVPREFSIFVKGEPLLNNPSQQTLFKFTKQAKQKKINLVKFF
jgi:hypothetical protein